MNSIKETIKYLPCFVCGKVVKGFGRGSKQLGCPTANFSDELVSLLPKSFQYGVYYGWASVDDGSVQKMVMSVGNNPHFHNTVKTMETHILHKFENDFYGSVLKVIVLGYLRQMTTFTTLEDLKSAINKDIEDASVMLDIEENRRYKNDSFFQDGGESLSERSNDIIFTSVLPDNQFICFSKPSVANGYGDKIQ